MQTQKSTSKREEILGKRREWTERDIPNRTTLRKVCTDLKERGVSKKTMRAWVECLNEHTPRYDYGVRENSRFKEQWTSEHADPDGFWMLECGFLFQLNEPNHHTRWSWVPLKTDADEENQVWIEKDDDERENSADWSTHTFLRVRVHLVMPSMSIIARKMPAKRILKMLSEVSKGYSFIPGIPTEIRWDVWEHLYF